jgi:hypothetical protein
MSGEDHADPSSHIAVAVRKPDPVVRAVTVSDIVEGGLLRCPRFIHI